MLAEAAAARHQAQSIHSLQRDLAAPQVGLGTRTWTRLPSLLLRTSPCWPPGTRSCPRDKKMGRGKETSELLPAPQAHKVHFQPETLNVNYVGQNKGLEIEIQLKQK